MKFSINFVINDKVYKEHEVYESIEFEQIDGHGKQNYLVKYKGFEIGEVHLIDETPAWIDMNGHWHGGKHWKIYSSTKNYRTRKDATIELVKEYLILKG